MKPDRWTVGLAALALLLVVLPIGWTAWRGMETTFEGSDGQAQALIGELRPGYTPWAVPWWRPPGPEIESMLFALQAAIGAAVLGYVFGRLQGRRAAWKAGLHAPD